VLPFVPELCPVCRARFFGGCAPPGHRFPKTGLRAFYDCGSRVVVIEAEYMEGDGTRPYSFTLTVSNCEGPRE
jgi:hypothetical protein